jgi:hypothetical protein
VAQPTAEGPAGEGRSPRASEGPEPGDPRVVAAIVALAVLPYASSVTFGFALDDGFAVLGHRGVHGPLSATELLLRDFWGRSFMDTIGSWRPVTTLTYWLDWHVGGGRPWVFHATNVALYAVLLVLGERFLARFFGAALPARARYGAVAAFGLLALHADVVPSVAGRAEILAAIFSLLAIGLALSEGPVRPVAALAAAGASLLAMASKESALPVALLAPVLAYRWHAHRGDGRGARGPGMLLLFASNAAVLAGVVVFRSLRMPWMALGPERAMENPLIGASVPARWLGAGAVGLHYLAHLAWPSGLAPDYSYAAVDVAHEPWLGAAGVALALGAAVALAVAWRRPPGAADALLALAASYVVVSHVFLPAVAVMADRLFFLPSLWVVVLGALLLEAIRRAAPRRWTPLTRAWVERPAGALLGIFVLGQGVVAAVDAAAWRNDVTLLTSAVNAQPAVARSRRNLAQALAEAGRPAEAAWQLVVSMTILARYPEPIAPDEFRSLDGQADAERIAALEDHIGGCALRARLEEARAAFARWDLGAARAQVDAWLAPRAEPPTPCRRGR